jgi:group I intron endonuclease
MATNKYQNAKVYKLVNDVDDKVYVGSTTSTLTKRKSEHKGDAKKATQLNRRVYKHLNEVGWENVEIVLVETYPCNSKDELNARERKWIDELKPSLNKALPCRTKKQWEQDNKEKVAVYAERKKQRRQDNKDKIAEMNKQLEQDNDTIAVMKKKCEEDKEKIAEKNMNYRNNNKEKIAEKKKQYEQDNKEKIAERKRQYRQDNIEVALMREKAYRERKRLSETVQS